MFTSRPTFVLFLIVNLHDTLCFNWTDVPGDNDKKFAMVGDSVVFPWDYSLSSNEVIDFTQYFFNESQLIAIYSHGAFIPQNAYSARAIKHSPFGLELKNVAKRDSGSYTIMVEGRTNSAVSFIKNRTVNLFVGQKAADFLVDFENRLSQMELHSKQQEAEAMLLKTELNQVKSNLNVSETKLAEVNEELSEVKSNLSAIQSREKRHVAFYASMLSSKTIANREIMKFTNVGLNFGDGYNPQTGVFTAPYNGLYFFSVVSAGKNANNLTGIFLEHDTGVLSTYDSVYSSGEWVPLVAQATCHLYRNEHVNVFASTPDSTYNQYSSFMGYLISLE